MDLNFKEFGRGEPIVILHGMFGTLDNWQTIAKKLAQNYSVYIIDQRNHGRSPHTDEMSYVLMAEDLQSFMESHWMYSATIIGHSMGGKTAMQFAMDFPDMVERLIVVDIAPKTYVGGHESIFEALFSIDLNTLESRKQADAILQERIPDFGVRQFLLKNLSRTKEGHYKWKMNLPVIHKAYQSILQTTDTYSTFEGSSLFIRGENSNYIQDKDFPTIKSIFPNSSIETVEGAGHWVHAEAPRELLGLVERFLEE